MASLCPSRMSVAGQVPFIRMRTASGGRTTRSADVRNRCDGVSGFLCAAPEENAVIRNASGARLSSNSAEPTRSSPTNLRSRASRISSRPASGDCGENNPCCTFRRDPAARAS